MSMEKYYKEIKLYSVPKVVQNRKKREKTNNNYGGNLNDEWKSKPSG